MTEVVKGFGRLRTKASSAGTRGPHALVYGQNGSGMVLVVERWRSVSVAAGAINVISCGAGLQTTLVLRARVPCARFNSGMGMRWIIGQDTMSATVVQGEPCRIMACSSGSAAPIVGERGAWTNGRRPQ